MAAKQKEAKAASFLDDILAEPRVKSRCWVDDLPDEGRQALQEVIDARVADRIPWGYMHRVYRKFAEQFGVSVNVCHFREYVNKEVRAAKAAQAAKR